MVEFTPRNQGREAGAHQSCAGNQPGAICTCWKLLTNTPRPLSAEYIWKSFCKFYLSLQIVFPVLFVPVLGMGKGSSERGSHPGGFPRAKGGSRDWAQTTPASQGSVQITAEHWSSKSPVVVNSLPVINSSFWPFQPFLHLLMALGLSGWERAEVTGTGKNLLWEKCGWNPNKAISPGHNKLPIPEVTEQIFPSFCFKVVWTKTPLFGIHRCCTSLEMGLADILMNGCRNCSVPG